MISRQWAQSFRPRVRRAVSRATYTSGLASYLASKKKGLVLLGYHLICEAGAERFLSGKVSRTDPDRFREHISFLKKAGLRFDSLDAVMDRIAQGGRADRTIVITFDDGFRSVYDCALPVLRELEIPATLFLTPSTIGSPELIWLHKLYYFRWIAGEAAFQRLVESSARARRIEITGDDITSNYDCSFVQDLLDGIKRSGAIDPEKEQEECRSLYLTLDQVREMMDGGITIENHGMNHLPMPQIDTRVKEEEILQAEDWIERHLGRRPRCYCYPFSRQDKEDPEILARLGYLGACSVGSGTNIDLGDPFSLLRFLVGNETIEEFLYGVVVRDHQAIRSVFRLNARLVF